MATAATRIIAFLLLYYYRIGPLCDAVVLHCGQGAHHGTMIDNGEDTTPPAVRQPSAQFAPALQPLWKWF